MTLSFTTGTSARTWGMDCSVLIERVTDAEARVTVRTQKKHQLYAWNVGESIAKKYFDAIQDELSKTQSSPKPNQSPVLQKSPAK